MTIVLATCSVLPDLDPDDQRLYHALKAEGVPVEIAVWDDSAVDWGRYAMCVIRSTWDYVPKREQYVQWAERVARESVLWNPAPVIRWNTDKLYLRELAANGVPTVETAWLSQGLEVDFKALLKRKNWTEVVIKPVVSASGKDMFRLTADTLASAESQLQALLCERDLMVQPFLPSVISQGELSLLYFNGQYSHAVTKKPAQGEYRVQEHLGGVFHEAHPTADVKALAAQVMAQIPSPTLYARVDFMLDNAGNYRLSELELTEPSMYMTYDAEAPQRFAHAVQARLAEILAAAR